ncbi:hypothetical protein EV361DRAFT_938467 [Lentinula raphanica]|nr:hypothetical protein EV361DRAFT_938467 [Lentinula raphanica]
MMYIVELPYLIRFKALGKGYFKGIPLIGDRYDWKVLLPANERAYETSLSIGSHLPSFFGKKDEESDPVTNVGWPFVGRNGPMSSGTSPDSPHGMGTLSISRARPYTEPIQARQELKQTLVGIRFQGGPLNYIWQAMHLLQHQHYIEKFPVGFEDGFREACAEEQKIWHEQFSALVVKLYGEAKGAKVEEVRKKLEWKLHRLFQNNCGLYDLEKPGSLESLVEFGQRFCVYTDGKIWSIADEYVLNH